MDSYFRCHIAPVMSKTRTYLTEKQGEEMMEYSTSPGGILSLMASSMQPLADPYQVLKATGEWNSKNHRGLYRNVQGGDRGSEAMQQDLATWPNGGARPSCRRWAASATTNSESTV